MYLIRAASQLIVIKGFMEKMEGKNGNMFSTADCTIFVHFKIKNRKLWKTFHLYPDFVLFTACNTKNQLACYMIHGLAPFPRVQFKLKSQLSDPMNENYFLKLFMG